MIQRTIVHRRNRRRPAQSNGPLGATVTPVCTIATAKLRITTNLPVTVGALPTGITVQGVAPTAYTVVSPTIFDLTYAANVVTTNVAVIPGNVSQVRSSTAGYLSALTVTL